jgi:membrane associated rhomboid family serine protease
MSSGPDLYLVCKSCGAEVSPYITECPYCGQRIQKRAPKLDRGGVSKGARARRARPQLPRLKPNEIPGIRADRRPWAVWGLVLASVLLTIALNSGLMSPADVYYGIGAEEPWRLFTTLFNYYAATGYEIVAVGAIALFGWLLERRHGGLITLFVFFATGVAGVYVAVQFNDESGVIGANGAALGLLAAWSVRDLLGRRRGLEDESDLLGVLAIAVLLVLLPLASDSVSGVAGLVGGALGLLLGLVLARLRER